MSVRQTIAAIAAGVVVITAIWLAMPAGHDAITGQGELRRDSERSPSAPPSAARAAERGPTESEANSLSTAPPEQAERGLVPVPQSTLHLLVLDADGNPVEKAVVQVVDVSTFSELPPDPVDCVAPVIASFAPAGETDSAGRLDLELRAGKHLFRVSGDWFQTASKVIDVAEQASAEIVLSEKLGFHGRVIHSITKDPIADASLAAVPRARVGQGESPDQFLERIAVGDTTRSSADGSFSFPHVTDEALIVRCRASGFAPVESMVYPSGQEVTIELAGSVAATGIVVDENGVPIPDAKVNCSFRGVMPSMYVGRTTSDPDGTFRFDALPTGDVSFWTVKDGFAVTKLLHTLEDGEEVFIELELVPEVIISGVVVDDIGRPVPGATVHTSDRDINGEVSYSVTTDDGTWWARWIHPEHTLDIDVEKEGYERLIVWGVAVDEEPKRLVLQKRGAIVGNVVDLEGRPVTRFAIGSIATELDQDIERDRRWRVKRDVFESSDGAFTIDGTRVSPYELTVEAPGFVRKLVLVEDVPRGGSTVGPITIVLEPGIAVSGRVVGENLVPGEGIPVSLAERSFQGVAVSAETAYTTTTDSNGEFTLRDVPESTFDLIVGSSSLGQRLYADLRPEDFPRDLVLERPGRIIGRVQTRWRSPATVLDAIVTRLGEWTGSHVPVRSDGSFIADRLAPGAYEVSVLDHWGTNEYAAYCRATAVVEVRTGEATEVFLDLLQRGRVRGIVECDPTLLEQVRLRIEITRGDDGELVGIAPVWGDGSFGFSGLPAGRYAAAVRSDAPGLLLDARAGFQLATNEDDVQCTIRVPSDFLEGIVEGLTEGAVAEVSFVSTTGGEASARVMTRKDGRYVARLDREGVFVVLVRAPGCADDWTARVQAPVSAGSDPIRHQLRPEARIEVAVVDDRERPVAGAAVGLTIAGRPSFLPRIGGVTDSLGRIDFMRLPAGRCTLSASKVGYVSAVDLPLHLDAGTTRSTTIRLIRTATVVASYDSRTAQQESSVVVTLEPLEADGSPPESKSLSVGEKARFEQLVPGRYRLAADETRPIEISLAPGETRVVELGAR